MSRAPWQSPTLAKIAEVSGVSSATVDRVLHNRGGVSQKKTVAVQRAMAELQAMQIRADPESSVLSFGLLIDSDASFTVALKDLISDINDRDPGVEIKVFSSLPVQFDPGAFSDKIIEWGEKYDGLILSCREHPAIARAIETTSENGTGVFCISTDQPHTRRIGYAGLDQVASGSCAAHLIGRFSRKMQGQVVLLGSAAYRCQEQRGIGFRRVIRSHYPDLSIVEYFNQKDNSYTAYEYLTQYLHSGNPPIAIYNVAGGNAGITRALVDAGLNADVLFVGHELTRVSSELLEEDGIDFILTHDISTELERATESLRAHCEGKNVPSGFAPLQPVIKCKYNLG
ncbi:LacI family transcriptional regulator [Cohaesibacter sp. ES.047]|uniref:LacI family DNA-binding transcriptional regulator n=1 Tax=Cohaesibacter sp. ES.047 TaxID=1798205 RepID=UPI000BBFBF50|nr:LacI family DNA-binding transcriptional regulator [Cohaesibacter sp. ES.047]SNY91683.1 LacI family transcriptional regulator [Cohaesibacter sp. ES.047]